MQAQPSRPRRSNCELHEQTGLAVNTEIGPGLSLWRGLLLAASLFHFRDVLLCEALDPVEVSGRDRLLLDKG